MLTGEQVIQSPRAVHSQEYFQKDSDFCTITKGKPMSCLIVSFSLFLIPWLPFATETCPSLHSGPPWPLLPHQAGPPAQAPCCAIPFHTLGSPFSPFLSPKGSLYPTGAWVTSTFPSRLSSNAIFYDRPSQLHDSSLLPLGPGHHITINLPVMWLLAFLSVTCRWQAGFPERKLDLSCFLAGWYRWDGEREGKGSFPQMSLRLTIFMGNLKHGLHLVSDGFWPRI